MFFEIINFYKKCENLKKIDQNNITLGDYLERDKNLSKYFINYHIDTNGSSAIWSMPFLRSCQSNAI